MFQTIKKSILTFNEKRTCSLLHNWIINFLRDLNTYLTTLQHHEVSPQTADCNRVYKTNRKTEENK